MYLSEFYVAYGDNDLVKMYEQKKYAEIDAYYIYPGYLEWDLKNDIALVKLKNPFNFTNSAAVQPACLPLHHQDQYDGILKVRSKFIGQLKKK